MQLQCDRKKKSKYISHTNHKEYYYFCFSCLILYCLETDYKYDILIN